MRINVIRPGGPHFGLPVAPNPAGLAKSRNQKAHSDSNISIREVVKKVGNRPEAESIEYVDKMTSSASRS